MPGVSEFFGNLAKQICQNLYQGLYAGIEEQFNSIADTMNTGITAANQTVTTKPQNWNSAAFDFIQGVAENACIPIAACILTFIFCWEVIHLAQESNQMHNIKPETMLMLMLKLGICLFVCSKSFEIVNGLFDVSAWASEKVNAVAAGADSPISLADMGLTRELPEYTMGHVFKMLANFLLTFFAKLIIYAITIAITLRVNLWYLELLVYASAAPIPFSTFINKEWGQMGTNYSRKMMAVAVEGFFMLVVFGLYGALSRNVLSASGADAYMAGMATTCGCGIALFLMLGKIGNISASIFNAH